VPTRNVDPTVQPEPAAAGATGKTVDPELVTSRPNASVDTVEDGAVPTVTNQVVPLPPAVVTASASAIGGGPDGVTEPSEQSTPPTSVTEATTAPETASTTPSNRSP
jgi:hypothetical protein